MRSFVYWNIHKKKWSVKALEGDWKGKVIAHAPTIRLDNVRFCVQEGGRDRVLKDGQKNVHAGVVGDLVSILGISEEEMGLMPPSINKPPTLESAPYLAPVHYVPALGPYFFWEDTMRPVTEAKVATFEPDKIVLAAPVDEPGEDA
ncbi:hypothetical protein [Thiohalorhabdus sp.]|uniref:hypothetical protein n=1 Tax=Thiohalorhabdus sp. TaxID=3094134 RepID=UPI002FC3829C